MKYLCLHIFLGELNFVLGSSIGMQFQLQFSGQLTYVH